MTSRLSLTRVNAISKSLKQLLKVLKMAEKNVSLIVFKDVTFIVRSYLYRKY